MLISSFVFKMILVHFRPLHKQPGTVSKVALKLFKHVLSAFVSVESCAIRTSVCPFLYINKHACPFSYRVFKAQTRHVNMKTIIYLMFLTAVVVYAEQKVRYHPQAILHYLEMEDQEVARKVRGFLKVRDFPKPTGLPSVSPSGLPAGVDEEDMVSSYVLLQKMFFFRID